jgi:hypothetical protein
MLMADKVAKKKFAKKKIHEENINALFEIHKFFFKYIDDITQKLSSKEKEKIWNEDTINICFKNYLCRHHKFKVSSELFRRINN